MCVAAGLGSDYTFSTNGAMRSVREAECNAWNLELITCFAESITVMNAPRHAPIGLGAGHGQSKDKSQQTADNSQQIAGIIFVNVHDNVIR